MPGGGSTYRRGGRPKGGLNKVTADVRKLAGVYTKASIELLAMVLDSRDQPMPLRIAAARELLDRGCGKPAQAITGPDGSSPISIIVRHIYQP
jgi:hypothetical protein